jgi:hypothetical protein
MCSTAPVVGSANVADVGVQQYLTQQYLTAAANDLVVARGAVRVEP